VLAPFARDAAVIESVLARADLTTEVAQSLAELTETVSAGVGAALLTEEALTRDGLQMLADLLVEQPRWSDLPVLLLLTQTDPFRPEAANYWEALSSTPSVTILRRPVPSITLVTAVRSALRARRRQYEVRDLIMKERVAREAAESAVRIKDEFLASVSHELRTPLSAILIWSKLLTAGRLSAEQIHQAVHAIVSGAEAQSRLIEDLLDIAGMVNGKLRLDIAPQRLLPIVLAAVEVVRPLAESKGVALDLQLGPTAARVQGDAQRLQQIFWNILSNAIKFTPSGGVVAVRLVHESNWLEISVADNGQGIGAEFLPHVFERFAQGGQNDTTIPRGAGVGLGLGLSIVRELVELHGGTVTAASAGMGRGSVFRVRLPAMTIAAADSQLETWCQTGRKLG
jgi:signal transduction histidine kinase